MEREIMAFTKSHLFVLISAISLSTILSFSKVLRGFGISSLEQMFLKVSLGCLYTLIILLLTGKFRIAKKEDLGIFTIFALSFSLFIFTALSTIALGTPIAVATALIYTQPVYTALIAHFSKEESIDLPKGAVMCLAIVGVVLVTGLAEGVSLSEENTLGIIVGVLAGIMYAVYLKTKRTVKKRGYQPSEMLFTTTLIAMPVIILLGLVMRLFIHNDSLVGFVIPEGNEWFYVLIFGVTGLALPYGILNGVNPKEITPTSEGLLLLLDPSLNLLWSIVIWHQFVSPMQYLGAGLVICAAVINNLLKMKKTEKIDKLEKSEEKNVLLAK
ncbi:MAG: DMT family transporter [Thermoplasmata archaeon]